MASVKGLLTLALLLFLVFGILHALQLRPKPSLHARLRLRFHSGGLLTVQTHFRLNLFLRLRMGSILDSDSIRTARPVQNLARIPHSLFFFAPLVIVNTILLGGVARIQKTCIHRHRQMLKILSGRNHNIFWIYRLTEIVVPFNYDGIRLSLRKMFLRKLLLDSIDEFSNPTALINLIVFVPHVLHTRVVLLKTMPSILLLGFRVQEIGMHRLFRLVVETPLRLLKDLRIISALSVLGLSWHRFNEFIIIALLLIKQRQQPNRSNPKEISFRPSSIEVLMLFIFEFLSKYLQFIEQNVAKSINHSVNMTTYTHLTYTETALMTIICVASNLTGLPIVIRAFRQKETHFEAYIFAMSIFTSFMYHLCQIYNCTIFLNDLQWHRLDNIFAIASFEFVILHLFGAITHEDIILKWSTLLTSIVIQEKDPWNVRYTIGPCLVYAIISIIIRISHRKSRQIIYNTRHMSIGTLFLCVGLFFFVDGLNSQNDYLRLSHGVWHLSASVFGYYCIEGVKITKIRSHNNKGYFQQYEQKHLVE